MKNIEMHPHPDGHELPMMEKGSCIGNSVETLIEYPDLGYAEGLARSALGLWYHHAWNVEEDGTVVDRTWTDGQRYIGRIWDREEVLDAVWEREVYDYMDKEAHPMVPEGEAGIECYTARQYEWIMRQLSA